MSTSPPTKFKLSDQVIGHIRELLTLCLTKQTSVIDHLRAIELTVSAGKANSLLLSEDYCIGWNNMIVEMEALALKEMQRIKQETEEAEKLAATSVPSEDKSN